MRETGMDRERDYREEIRVHRERLQEEELEIGGREN